jgi:AcrR family transcriptional regulator
MVEKEEIREQIIAASRQIFSRFGFKKTTMDEIAQSVNKGKSSIYYYYASKEDIYKAVIEKEASIIRDELTNAIRQATDPVEKLKTYVRVRMRTFHDMANFYEAIKNEFLTHLDFVNKVREKYDKEEMQMVESFLKEGVAQKQFIIDNTELAAIAIVTAMKGLEIPLFKYNNQLNWDERMEHLLNVLLYGVVRR